MRSNKVLIALIILIIAVSAYRTGTVQDYLQHSSIMQEVNYKAKAPLFDKLRSDGFKDFNQALIQIDSVCDEETLNSVTKLLMKSGEAKYYPAYMALGTLYQNKHLHGSVYYGVKGTPDDLSKAIEYLTIAASHGSAIAQNALGEIYLHEANIHDQSLRIQLRDVEDSQNLIKVPDLTKAIYWFEKAAKNGNPAAQGTLSDLYKQGIGVSQDYVMAYVWDNIGVTSQSKFNDMMHKEIGRELMQTHMKGRDEIYQKLTDEQKKKAQKLVAQFSKKYIIQPSEYDLDCLHGQKIVLAHTLKVLTEVMEMLLRDFK